ncbi:hypothetical protein TI39_contig603g00009 [Zymoseptoria brevis]|uniref:Ubiquitin-like domain-containing protein n=1 Tax=Zymoseptoria brevis TaxID=1047168 RepID=A0A0F4GGY8_9PEZI|nr:hypothetical protein TI39_contig603g00009 [Zymoseptoria brevis]
MILHCRYVTPARGFQNKVERHAFTRKTRIYPTNKLEVNNSQLSLRRPLSSLYSSHRLSQESNSALASTVMASTIVKSVTTTTTTNTISSTTTTTTVQNMTIAVRTLTGKIVELQVCSTDTVLRLKERLEDKEGIPPAQQRLIHEGKQMNDMGTMEMYGIQHGAMVMLVPSALSHFALYNQQRALNKPGSLPSSRHEALYFSFLRYGYRQWHCPGRFASWMSFGRNVLPPFEKHMLSTNEMHPMPQYATYDPSKEPRYSHFADRCEDGPGPNDGWCPVDSDCEVNVKTGKPFCKKCFPEGGMCSDDTECCKGTCQYNGCTNQ